MHRFWPKTSPPMFIAGVNGKARIKMHVWMNIQLGEGERGKHYETQGPMLHDIFPQQFWPWL